jgi:hypothetical protein
VQGSKNLHLGGQTGNVVHGMPMTRDRARRFAQILLKDFGHEGHFDIVLPEVDLNVVREVLVTELKCTVKLDALGRRLTITCPQSSL